MSSEYVWIDIDGQLDESDKARKVITHGRVLWIPKSAIGAVKKGERAGRRTILKIELKRWLAVKEGFVEPEDPKDEL